MHYFELSCMNIFEIKITQQHFTCKEFESQVYVHKHAKDCEKYQQGWLHMASQIKTT